MPAGRPRGGQHAHRPPPDPERVREALALAASTSPEEAAEKLTAAGRKVSSRSIRVWIDKYPELAPGAAPPPPAPAAKEAPKAAAPAGPDFALVRRILAARDPAALAEVDAGLAAAAQGEAALLAWLARPPEDEDDGEIDPLEACSRALAVATSHLERVPPMHARAASLSTAVANLAARVEKIAAGRPQPPTVDEVTARINARRDDAIRQIMQHTGDAAAKLEADRVELLTWAEQNLGPLIGAELRRRVDAMLRVE